MPKSLQMPPSENQSRMRLVRTSPVLKAAAGALLFGTWVFSGQSFAAEAAAKTAAKSTAETTTLRTADNIAQLAGEWTVDLRPSLDDAVYTQPMVLTIAKDGVVTGSFYQSDILAGRAGRGQGRLCIAFRTTDGAGFYHSAACLVEGKLVGQTWAEGRNFVLPWTAVAKAPALQPR